MNEKNSDKSTSIDNSPKIDRRNFLIKGAKVAAGVAGVFAGLGGLGKAHYDAVHQEDPNAFKGEVELSGDLTQLIEEIKAKFNIGAEVDMSGFSVSWNGYDRSGKLSFVLTPPNPENRNWPRVFASPGLRSREGRENVVELTRLKTPGQISWGIFLGEAQGLRDVPPFDSVITLNYKRDGELFAVDISPLDEEVDYPGEPVGMEPIHFLIDPASLPENFVTALTTDQE